MQLAAPEAVVYFASADYCREYMVARRWPNGVVCPTCGSANVRFQPAHNRWQCSAHHARRQFTLKTRTIMEDSPIGLDKWSTAMWLVPSNRNRISAWELHRETCVRGNVHTSGMENFWSLLKRGLNGTYVSVEPFHLFRYVDEQAFRFNNRKPMSDADRFSFLVQKIVGKRLTYAELTGKTEAGPSLEEAF